MLKSFFIAFLMSLIPVAVMSHPGHGETEGFTITHYLVEPIHVIVTIGILFFVVVMIKWFKRKRKLS